MAEKIKTNDYGECVYSEDAVIDLLYQNPDLDISKLYTDSINYNKALQELEIELPKLPELQNRTQDIKEFDQSNYDQWYMPESYTKIDIKKYLLDKCSTQEEQDRVLGEYKLYEQKNFIKVLQFLIYFVDTLRQNNIVWGVGRGSSVSSFCLFLIGVHKINPLQYNLDYREFLR